MIVDASALLAILLSEPERTALEDKLAQSPAPRMSAGTCLEASIVVDSRLDPVTTRLFDDLIASSGVNIETVTHEQELIARRAYRDFGRESKSAARLNFGDCFSYALAKSRDEPLLFKGDDFIHTDIRPAR
jgi:ribonuclease VapC